MKLVIAGDKNGIALADAIYAKFWSQHQCHMIRPDDFTSYVSMTKAAVSLLRGNYDRAILVCGTGIGVCIAANKFLDTRAALVHDVYSAERAALSNNANVLCMGGLVIGKALAIKIVDTWLGLEFDHNGRSAESVAAIDNLPD